MMGTGLHLALFNPTDPALPMAERELALRLARATEQMGWEAAILSRSAQVEAMDPDAVLCLHPQVTAKLTRHPWLACYWNPPSLLKGASETARRFGEAFELTYDGYLVSGPQLEAHLAGLMAGVGRDPPTLPFHVSSPRSDLAPSLGPDSRLFYVGSNWDGRRYPSLLRRLAEAGVLALHGTAERWSHLPEAYQGPLPFDGRSVIDAAHHWGMGLCLHLPQHRADGVPNMRVFELAAAGAVIIADRHPFITHWFGDSVLYVDVEGGEEETAGHILDRIDWVRAHPAEARAMAVEAQAIFNRALCLEALLEPLPGLLAELERRRPRPSPTRVGVLLPGCGPERRLGWLAAQEGDGMTLTALLPEGTGGDIPPPVGINRRFLSRSAGLAELRAALAGLDALAILPDHIAWHPGHLAALAAATGPGGAALASGLWPLPTEPAGFPIDPAEQLALPPPDGARLPEGRETARAWLRAGGLYCRVERLDGLSVEGGDWTELALNLAPTLAGSLALPPVPSLTLSPLPETDITPLAWPVGRSVEHAERPPRLAGIGDLNPDLADSVSWIWHPRDFARMPETGPIWLYGAGQGGELVHDGLPAGTRARLRGFLDSHRQGEMLGLPVCRPQDMDPVEIAEATIIIAAQYVSDILRTLRRGTTAPACILNAYPYIVDRLEAAVPSSGLALSRPGPGHHQ